MSYQISSYCEIWRDNSRSDEGGNLDYCSKISFFYLFLSNRMERGKIDESRKSFRSMETIRKKTKRKNLGQLFTTICSLSFGTTIEIPSGDNLTSVFQSFRQERTPIDRKSSPNCPIPFICRDRR